MAGNFWKSSHYQQWLLDRQDLVRDRSQDLARERNTDKALTEDEYQKIFIFFANFIQTLGEQLKLRQQVIATATVYFKRYYARNSLKCIDPLLMSMTCIFLASKVEESGVIANPRFMNTCQQVAKSKFSYAFSQDLAYKIQNVLECEFYLLEAMDCCLILYHPYRPLVQYANDLQESLNLQGEENPLLPLAWRLVNDSLRTDVSLLYPPYLIALAALYMTCVIQQREAQTWFAELNVDLEKILEITREILRLYELWKNYDEKKEIPGLLNKMPKPRTSPSRPPSQGPNGDVQQGQLGQQVGGHASQQSQQSESTLQ